MTTAPVQAPHAHATPADPGGWPDALRPSPRLPVLFLGHGSPMNAIEPNAWHQAWVALGQRFGPQGPYPRPQLVLCVSAHWLTTGWQLTGQAQPPTLHDFHGFPPALFAVRYPAPGWPEVAQALSEHSARHGGPRLTVNPSGWGLDHGAWGVLGPLFPQADVPVLQLSLDPHQPPAAHVALGEWLRPLRDRGVLLVASGNAVHNLHALNPDDTVPPPDWALAFDQHVAQHLQSRNHAALAGLLDGSRTARLAHPTPEHWLPLLVAAGASHDGDPMVAFNTGFQWGSIGMRSVVWG